MESQYKAGVDNLIHLSSADPVGEERQRGKIHLLQEIIDIPKQLEDAIKKLDGPEEKENEFGINLTGY